MDWYLGFSTKSEDGGGRELTLHSKSGTNGGTLEGIRLRYFDDEEESDEANDDKYDALNDETFGAADKGDWECFHEQLVRLELDGQKRKGPATGINVDGESQSSATDTLFDDYDLDLELRSFDCYETNDEASSRSSPGVAGSGDELVSKLRLDPKIWDSTIKQSTPKPSSQLSSYQPSGPSGSQNARPLQDIPSPLVTMLSVQDIERNVIQQQQQQKQLVQQQHLLLQQQQLIAHQQQQILHQSHLQASPHFSKPNAFPPAMPKQQYRTNPPQAGIPGMMLPSMSPHGMRTPLVSAQLQATNLNLLYRGCAPGPSFLPPRGLEGLPVRYMPYNMLATPISTPMNNFTVHPAFGHPYAYPTVCSPYRPQIPVVPIRHPASPFLWSPNTYNARVQALAASSALRNNQYNQCLMQEIQQNHPLLAHNRQVTVAGQNQSLQQSPLFHAYQSKQQAALQQQQEALQQQQRPKDIGDGLQAGDYDEYANIMSNREKLWLVGLQWAQLNLEIPYYSDYYFTMHRHRLAALKSNRTALTQCNTDTLSKLAKSLGPMGMVLNPFCLISANYCRNGLEGKQVATESGDTNTPLRCENSLGKVCAGSFTTPRKLIEMSTDGESDQSAGANTAKATAEFSLIQRKVRNVLLLIENLYTLVLKMEDLGNPLAVEAARLLHEKRVRDGELIDAIPHVDEHAFSGLADALVSSVSQDAISAILGVRKGKTLLRRVLTLLRNHSFRWTLWMMIFKAVPFLRRSDRVDAGGFLVGLFDEFECQLRDSKMLNLLRISESIDNDCVLRSIRDCNFVMSSIVCIIFQVELIYGRNPHNIQFSDQEQWVAFLEHVLKAITDAVPLECSIRMRPDSNIVHTLRVHFERFGSRIDGSDLLDFISSTANENNGNASGRN
ncbi:protein PAT1 homolog 1-like [Anopheles aquasalis]|uniref:protein PAT1 homolog 1-like n=1 Tax=Anopheles aquasalis TaxID=42839 RepID=UPI00215A39AB|nr:protein PAT1 homolog 1-like [Anopheles aquasalis]